MLANVACFSIHGTFPLRATRASSCVTRRLAPRAWPTAPTGGIRLCERYLALNNPPRTSRPLSARAQRVDLLVVWRRRLRILLLLNLHSRVSARRNALIMRLYIRGPGMPLQITIDVEYSDLIESVKRKITLASGINFEQHELVFAGKILQDSRTLVDYDIQMESTLHIINRTRGG